jgi:hypothetical protein
LVFGEALKRLVLREHHSTKSSLEASVFLKLSFFWIANTAGVLFFLTPFDAALSVDHLERVRAVVVCDAVLFPMLCACDFPTLFRRRVLVHLCRSQEKMNALYAGAAPHFGERYAAVAKTVFAGLWYVK